MRRLWVCPECGSLTMDFGNNTCLACEAEIDECDKQYQPEDDEYADDLY